MIIAGIDYSITGPALCIHKGSVFSFNNCKFYFFTKVKKYHQRFMNGKITGLPLSERKDDMVRFDQIASEFVFELEHHGVDHVGLEGYSYSSRGMVFHIGENTGILKNYLWKAHIPFDIFSPGTVKNTAGEKGNCNKDVMYDAFKKETNVDLLTTLSYTKSRIDSPIADIVDSFYVCKTLHETITKQ